MALDITWDDEDSDLGIVWDDDEPSRSGVFDSAFTGDRLRQAEAAPIDQAQLLAMGASRPRIENPDGTFSTEETITVEMDGRYLNIPTIVGGRRVTEDQAISAYRSGRNPAVGEFTSLQDATTAAEARSRAKGRSFGDALGDVDRALSASVADAAAGTVRSLGIGAGAFARDAAAGAPVLGEAEGRLMRSAGIDQETRDRNRTASGLVLGADGRPLYPDAVVPDPVADLRRERVERGVQAATSARQFVEPAAAFIEGKAQEQRDLLSTEGRRLSETPQFRGNVIDVLKGDTPIGSLGLTDAASAAGVVQNVASSLGSTIWALTAGRMFGSHVAAGAAGGLAAGSEGAQQARQRIGAMPHEQLMQDSPLYASLVNDGVDPAIAREHVVQRGEEAAATLQGLVAGFGDAFTSRLLSGGVRSIARLPSAPARIAATGAVGATEEGAQELTEGLAAERGINIVARTPYGEDSFANLALGALGGKALGTAGAAAREVVNLQAPDSPTAKAGISPVQVELPPADQQAAGVMVQAEQRAAENRQRMQAERAAAEQQAQEVMDVANQRALASRGTARRESEFEGAQQQAQTAEQERAARTTALAEDQARALEDARRVLAPRAEAAQAGENALQAALRNAGVTRPTEPDPSILARSVQPQDVLRVDPDTGQPVGPFSSRESAQIALTRRALTGSHVVVPVEGGYVLRQATPAAPSAPRASPPAVAQEPAPAPTVPRETPVAVQAPRTSDVRATSAVQASGTQAPVVPPTAGAQPTVALQRPVAAVRADPFDDTLGDDAELLAQQQPAEPKVEARSPEPESAQPSPALNVEQARQVIRNAVGPARSREIDIVDVVDRPAGAQTLISAGGIEGWYDPTTRRIAIVAGSLRPVVLGGRQVMSAEERAAWVAWHELGHRGVHRRYGPDYNAAMDEAVTNSVVKNLAGAIRGERGSSDPAGARQRIAVEEALAELAAAVQTGNYEHLRDRYGVRVSLAQRRTLPGLIARLAEKVREVIGKVLGRPVEGMSDADVFRLVRGLVEEEAGRGAESAVRGDAEPRTSQAPRDSEAFVSEVLAELAQHDEFFRYPVSTSRSLEGVMADVFPRAEYLGEDTRPDEASESGADVRHVFRTPEGKSLYVFERGRDVWIDVSRLEEGERGSGFYAAILNYAYNVGKRLVGDPAGLSEAAVVRRTSAMLSSALRFGTTEHMDAANEQLAGIPAKGIAPLRWQGDDLDKVTALIETFLSTLYTQFPGLEGFRYDFRGNRFLDRRGRPVDAARLEQGEGRPEARRSRAGQATLRRGIFLKSLVESPSGERPRLLEEVLTRGRSLVHDGGLSRLFSRRPEPLRRDSAPDSDGLPDRQTAPAADDGGGDLPGTAADDDGGRRRGRYTLPEWNNIDAAQRALQDNQNRWQDVERAIKAQGGILDEFGSTGVYRAMERMPGRLSAHVETFLETKVSPMLRLMGRHGIRMGELGEYLYALHAPERNAAIAERNPLIPEGGSGMTDAEAAALVAKYEDGPKGETFRQLATMAREIADAKITLLERSGLISAEAAQAMRERFPNYVPLKGFAEEELEPIEIRNGNGTGQGFAPNVPLKRAAGRTTRAALIVENLIRDYQLAALAAEKNNIAKYVRNFMLANPDPALWTVGQPEPAAVHAPDGTVRYQVTPMLDDTEIPVYIDGQRVRLQLHDQVALEQYRKLGIAELNVVMQAFEAVNNWLRAAYTGKNPAFIVVNAARDAQEGLVMALGEGGARLSAGMAQHYPAATRALYQFERARQAGRRTGGEWAQWIERYRRAGGSTGAGWVEDLVKTQAMLRRELSDHTLGGDRFAEAYERAGGGAAGVRAASAEAVYKLFSNRFFDYIEALNATTENAARLSVFRAAIEQGMSTNQAASIAKNLTMNFNRKGDLTGFMGALYLFFNPAVQGTKRLYDALARSPYRSAVWTAAGSITALGYVMGMLGFMMSGDDDEERLLKYGQIPDYEKERNMVISLGEHRLNIPLAYGLSFFYNIGQALADIQNGVREPSKAAYGLASAFAANFSPLELIPRSGDSRELIMNIIPTAAQPLAQSGLNIAGHGGQLFPEFPGQEGVPDSQKVSRGTKGSAFDKTAQALNEITGGTPYRSGWIDVSPETLKMTVRHFAGGAGQFLFDLAETPTELAQFGETDVNNIPIVRSFLKERSVRDSRRQFYELLREAETASQAIKRGRDALKGVQDDATYDRWQADIEGLERDQEALLWLARGSRRYRTAVNRLRDEAIAAQANPDLTAATKRRMVRQAEEAEREYQEDVLKSYFREVTRARGTAPR